MNDSLCHTADERVRKTARAVLLDVAGAKRVAQWCGVQTDTVYQWLSRGTEQAPIPAAHAITILWAARSEGLAIETTSLLPGMPQP